jgi:hypothetical protein
MYQHEVLTTKAMLADMKHKHDNVYYIGIDPQPSLLAICCMDPKQEIMEWFDIRLHRKDTYKSAEDWGIYVAHQAKVVLADLKELIFTYHKQKFVTRNKMLRPTILLCIEQQRGRVNSLIEGYLVGVGVDLDMNILVPHPNKWKSKVGLVSEPGNKANKTASLKMYVDQYVKYCDSIGKRPGKRLHDLCDAKCLAIYAHMLADPDAFDSGTGDKGTQETDEEEKDVDTESISESSDNENDNKI